MAQNLRRVSRTARAFTNRSVPQLDRPHRKARHENEFDIKEMINFSGRLSQ
jgi:hypothetical protein